MNYRNKLIWYRICEETFLSELEWGKRFVIDHMISSMPTGEREAQIAVQEINETYTCDENDDPSYIAEMKEDRRTEILLRFESIRQSAINMSSVMLWHLLEQQILEFYMKTVLSPDEERLVRYGEDKKMRYSSLYIVEMLRRLRENGLDIEFCPSWSKVEELRMLANALKHGIGRSSDKLNSIRPDLFIIDELLQAKDCGFERSSHIRRPAGGDGIYVRESDVVDYFDAAINLWKYIFDRIEELSSLESNIDSDEYY